MTRILWRLAVAALAITVAACGGDATMAPLARLTSDATAPGSFRDDLSGLRGGGPGALTPTGLQVSSGTDTVFVLKRSALLASDISATKLIGPEGGEIRLAGAGARIIFPRGAVKEPTSITMTAKRGWNVAFEFAPHGITFAVAASIEQDLRFTLVGKDDKTGGLDLQAGYYTNLDDSFVDRWKLFARVTEVRRVRKPEPRNPHLVTFPIDHFSGYLMSSGFKGRFGGFDDEHGNDRPF